jgi:hypothetical protein
MLTYDTQFSFQVDFSEMDSDDDIQEIDPPVITRCGCKKYRRRILKEELDVRFCDRTTSKMRGPSPQDQSEDSRQSENAQTHIRSIQRHD